MSTSLPNLDRIAPIGERPAMPVTVDTPPSADRSSWRMLRSIAATVAVWVLYVPHYAILRLLGPRYGMAWVRIGADVHWLLTFVGAQRPARRSIEQLRNSFDADLSVSEILFEHLLLKHECFARVRVYNLHGASSRRNDVRWQTERTCLPAVPTMEGRKGGLIIVGFHFGFFQMSATALSQIVPGCNPTQLRYRHAQCAEQTLSPIARYAFRKVVDADRRSGASIIYLDASTPLLPLFRLLRAGGCAAVAADGMSADDFIRVPFFDGTLQVPVGWARLAAITHSEIRLVCDTAIDRHRRDLWFFDHVQCAGYDNAAVERAVAEAIHTLELMIRREPWAWHPWQRLRWERDADGSPRYYLRQFGTGSKNAANHDVSSFEHHSSISSATEGTGSAPAGQRCSAAERLPV
jgi:lauroyl/myristoyl acyltransferase